jgi:hypothetical protein
MGIDQITARHQFGQDHGGDLHGLDFFVTVASFVLVLHHQNAGDPTRPQDRNAHQRTINILSGFRPVDECRMGLCIGQGQRLGVGGNLTDQALANPEPGLMHGPAPETLSGKQFKHFAGALDINRADLRGHAGGDDLHHLVQFHLGGGLAGHEVSDSSQ